MRAEKKMEKAPALPDKPDNPARERRAIRRELAALGRRAHAVDMVEVAHVIDFMLARNDAQTPFSYS